MVKNKEVIWVVIESHKYIGTSENEIAIFNAEKDAKNYADKMNKVISNYEYVVKSKSV